MGYGSMHDRVRRIKGSADKYPCTNCGRKGWINDWAYDHKDPDERIGYGGLTYSEKLEHYIVLCRSCHKKIDNQYRA